MNNENKKTKLERFYDKYHKLTIWVSLILFVLGGFLGVILILLKILALLGQTDYASTDKLFTVFFAFIFGFLLIFIDDYTLLKIKFEKLQKKEPEYESDSNDIDNYDVTFDEKKGKYVRVKKP